MLSLDLRSLTIMAGLIGIVMGLVLLGLRRSYPPSIRGMRLWGAAPLLCASSTLAARSLYRLFPPMEAVAGPNLS